MRQRDRERKERKKESACAAMREVIPDPEGISSRLPRVDAIDPARVGRFTTIVDVTPRNCSCNASRRGCGDAAISEGREHERAGVPAAIGSEADGSTSF